MDKFRGNGDVEQRLDRIERWICAHEEWCRGHMDATTQAELRNAEDHRDIKKDLKAVNKHLSRINIYIGGAIVIATVLGHVVSDLLANSLK